MAKAKEQIKVVGKSVKWLKDVIGLTDDFVTLQNIKGFSNVYVYEMYPYGGGDDQIKLVAYRKELSDEEVQKCFANSKIRGKLFGDVCFINLRAV